MRARARVCACVAVIWEWEYGDRSNVTRVKEKLFPLVKGEADFFSCWLQLNETDGKLHDLHDCTSESKGICAGMDSTMTLSMARRSFDVVSEMATFVGETVDPKWCDAKTTPLCVSLLLMFRDVFTHERDRS